ncbi:MAG: Ig-like domain-containing domain, partial [Bacteroidota bacterium]|nr:Ig-like domain-containing domain [Bacteroidota bacterium]
MLLIGFAYLVFNSSCANQGMPTGGPLDSIPPVLLNSVPKLNEKNVKASEVALTFDEYIIPDEVNNKLIISPPLKRRPIVRMKGKTLLIQFKDTLRPETTYSFNFQDAIADNNERNPIPDLKLAFSTGNTIDSLRISGTVRDAFTLEPLDLISVFLYKDLSDSAIYRGKPDYMGRTNKEGFFEIVNIPKEKFRIFAFKNEANDYRFNPEKDQVAFLNKVITPDSRFNNSALQKIVRGKDTITVKGKTEYLPEPLWLMAYREPYRTQRIENSKRTQKNHCVFNFLAPTDDALKFEPIHPKITGDWNIIRKGVNKDTIDMWITHPDLLKQDSIMMRVTYNRPDSAGKLALTSDTVALYFKDLTITDRVKKKKKKGEDKPEVPTFLLSSNTSKDFDLNRDIVFKFSEPIQKIDTSMFHLDIKQDTIYLPIKKLIQPDPSNILQYTLKHNWQERAEYRLTVDSAAVKTISGAISLAYKQNFNIQAESFYGKIIVKLTGPKDNCILQVIENDDKEQIRSQQIIKAGETVTFSYLQPKKYKLKVIVDANKNGKWDSGDLRLKQLPEEVYYYPEIIKLRSNWERNLNWNVALQPGKKVRDPEVEAEELKKKQEEK